MATDRRQFLVGLGALVLARPAFAGPTGSFLAARGDDGGGFYLSRFAADGTMAYDVALPGRGHGMAVSPDGRSVIAVARRPGQFLLVVDVASGAFRRHVTATDEFVFCGHAVFSADGRLLYTTEICEDDGGGQVGVYDVRAGFRRTAAWPTHGDDPHQLLLVGGELVVANGGFGPEGKAMIDPSLVWLDARDGRLIAQAKPPEELRRVSLRHMAIAGGAVFVAGQYAGPSQDRPPLLVRAEGYELRYLEGGREGMANYCGSIAANAAGTALCLTSPHGGRALILDTDGREIARYSLGDVCGVAPSGEGFLLTSGRGDMLVTDDGASARIAARWDNHAAAI